jgi:hypothetical protein
LGRSVIEEDWAIMQLHGRFTVRRMMTAVAVVAVLLALRASLQDVLQKKIWYGRNPFLGTSTPFVQYIAEPRLGFLFIPLLAVVVALNKPPRRLVWVAKAEALLAIGSWVFIRRPMGYSPGGLFFWPDYFTPLLSGNSLRQGYLFAPFYRIFMPSTVGEVVDLASLFGCLCLLVTLLWQRQPPSRRLRAFVSLAAIAYPCGAWVARMWSDRYIGFGKAPFRTTGLGGYYLPRPTLLELAEGILLASVLVYLAKILVHTRSLARSTSSRAGSGLRPTDVPPCD